MFSSLFLLYLAFGIMYHLFIVTCLVNGEVKFGRYSLCPRIPTPQYIIDHLKTRFVFIATMVLVSIFWAPMIVMDFINMPFVLIKKD